MLFVEQRISPQAPFLKPFLDFWYTNFSVVELLIRAEREDILRTAFRRMADSLRSEYPHVEIAYYNYFIEVRSAVSIALLTEWVKNGRSVTPDQLVKLFERQMILDTALWDLVKP